MNNDNKILQLESRILNAEKQFKKTGSLAWELKVEHLREKLKQVCKKVKSADTLVKKQSKEIPVKKSINYPIINQFSDIEFTKFILQNLEIMNIKQPTIIQKNSVRLFLKGNDLVLSSRTGSGKTLAFLIPLVESLAKQNPIPLLSSLVLLPTRELAVQVCSQLKKLLSGSMLKAGLVKGGGSRTSEFEFEIQSSHILVATPGRLVDHLKNGSENGQYLSLKNVRTVIIDEADIMLDQGHLDTLRFILDAMPSNRQSVLVSATINKASRNLIAIALKKNYILVNEENDESVGNRESEETAFDIDEQFNTVRELTQGFVICPTDRRLCCLYTFLKLHKDKKTMVFMSARDEVMFYSRSLPQLGLSVLHICGSMTQSQRSQALAEFANSNASILLCTSIAARGLDIPRVHCVIQYDSPQDVKEYIHRVGRTARAGNKGHALLILKPHEIGFLQELKMSNVEISEYEFDFSKVADIRSPFQSIVEKDPLLQKLAKDAFASYLRGYASADNQEHFNVKQLCRNDLAVCFGLKNPPEIHLQVKCRLEERSLWSNVLSKNSKYSKNKRKIKKT